MLAVLLLEADQVPAHRLVSIKTIKQEMLLAGIMRAVPTLCSVEGRRTNRSACLAKQGFQVGHR